MKTFGKKEKEHSKETKKEGGDRKLKDSESEKKIDEEKIES